MVVTPVMVEQMGVNLPEKTETLPEDDVPEEQILVAACKDGTFALNRKVLALNKLTDTVRKKIIKKRSKGEAGVVFVDGHPEVDYNQMVHLMDAVRDAGQQADIRVKIGLASLKTTDDFRACTPPEPTPVAPVTPTEGVAPTEGG